MGRGVPTSGVAGRLAWRPVRCAGLVHSVFRQADWQAFGLIPRQTLHSCPHWCKNSGRRDGAVVGRGPRGAGRRDTAPPCKELQAGHPTEQAAPLPAFMLVVPPGVQVDEVSPRRAGCLGRRGRRPSAPEAPEGTV